MGLWQLLVEGYDENYEHLQETYPLSSTTITNASKDIPVVVIDNHGNFLELDKIPKKKEGMETVDIPIPVTQESVGRSGPKALSKPHPLFDYVKIVGQKGANHDNYVRLLKTFADSQYATDEIRAVCQFIIKDPKLDSYFKDMKGDNIVLFEVQTPEKAETKLWKQPETFMAWHNYYTSALKANNASEKADRTSLDFMEGKQAILAISHPKKIVNSSANSKLISSNDEKNYTFRGRFSSPAQAVSIGYEASQKAHQFLRYLINTKGISIEEQVIVPFFLHSSQELPPPPVEDKDLEFALVDDDESPLERKSRADQATGKDYALSIWKALNGIKLDKIWSNHAKAAILILDSATSGRLSITFYREMNTLEYLEKIHQWHQACRWKLTWTRVDPDKTKRRITYFGAPSIDKIVEVVSGFPAYDPSKQAVKVHKKGRETLMRTIFDGTGFPADYLLAAVRRTSNPLSISDESSFDRRKHWDYLSVTCAMLRHEYSQKNKENIEMTIQLERQDRDYLYGRLLGAADKLEEYALYKKENIRLVTAAIRYMQLFSQRPATTWSTIHDTLNPYIQQVKNSIAYQELQTIHDLFKVDDFMDNSPLTGMYLIGYYHERSYIDQLISAKKAEANNKAQEEE